jgi:hypothetical protein
MPRGSDDSDLTEHDRHAIARIRRQLDAEFGALEEARPLDPRESRLPPPSPGRLAGRPSLASGRPRRPAPRRPRAAVLFLLGALVGGIAGGAAGAITAVRWLEPDATRARGTSGREAGAATARESGLGAALDEWLDATKRGDVERQMRYYPARVPVYYTWRNVGREAVRDEKLKVFGAATRLEIATGAPEIQLADGGRSALARFRKRYVIEGPVVRRRGEVVQELSWVRTRDGWRIVGERDAEVLSR